MNMNLNTDFFVLILISARSNTPLERGLIVIIIIYKYWLSRSELGACGSQICLRFNLLYINFHYSEHKTNSECAVCNK